MSIHTDMRDKYCGHWTFTLFEANIQRWRPLAATTKEVPRPYGRGTSFVVSFVLALNRVNVVAVTTILVLHVGLIGHHVPCHYDFMFPRRSYHAHLRAREVREALPPGRGVWGRLRPAQGKAGRFGVRHAPQWYVRGVLLFSPRGFSYR